MEDWNNKNANIALLKELPYYNYRGDISLLHVNSLTDLPTKRNLDKLSSLYELDLFSLKNIHNDSQDTHKNLLNQRICCRYFSPQSFKQLKSKKIIINQNDCNFSIFHNVSSLNRNLENLQCHLLNELDFHFNIIGVTETKITNSNIPINCSPKIPGYNFEYVPTALASGGVGMFIDEAFSYKLLEKISNQAFQAMWIEIFFESKKNVICGIVYRQHNSPEQFQQYFEETIERLTFSGKNIYIMGGFNIDLLKSESNRYSHDFLVSLQSCYLIPTVDKPTRVRTNSASLIDNILVNNPDQVIASGNIISDISDHFSQFCIIKSSRDKRIFPNKNIRDYSQFSSDSFHHDLSQVDWDETVSHCDDVNQSFSSFYNKFNKIVNKHAPMKIISKRKTKQLSKPWITKGIRTSIKIKNNFF